MQHLLILFCTSNSVWVNPRACKVHVTNTPMWYGGGGGVVDGTLPWVFVLFGHSKINLQIKMISHISFNLPS